MTPASTLAATLETALDALLSQDPASAARCKALAGKCIAVTLTGTGVTLYFLPDSQGIQVLSEYEGDVDTRLTGSPLGFARLGLDNSEDALFQGAVQLEGDTGAGQQFQDILTGVDIDWEEQLSHVTGDVIAHQAGRLARHAAAYFKDAANSAADNSSEYLQEEAQLLPARVEIDYFLDDVDTLRSDLDRLSERVARLQRLLDDGAS